MLRSMSRRISAVSLFLLLSLCALAQSKSRHFELNYSFTVRITDPGKPLDVWFPLAQSDKFQQVNILSKSCDLSRCSIGASGCGVAQETGIRESPAAFFAGR
jgi:hypothetical protein